MFDSNSKIIEALATIKANTKNHQDELQELKCHFDKHVDKEELQVLAINNKFDEICKKIVELKCPLNPRMEKLENDYIRSHNTRAKELIFEAEQKAIQIRERVVIDKEVAEELASLRTSKKYTYIIMAGTYTVLAIILKKIFMSS